MNAKREEKKSVARKLIDRINYFEFLILSKQQENLLTTSHLLSAIFRRLSFFSLIFIIVLDTWEKITKLKIVFFFRFV